MPSISRIPPRLRMRRILTRCSLQARLPGRYDGGMSLPETRRRGEGWSAFCAMVAVGLAVLGGAAGDRGEPATPNAPLTVQVTPVPLDPADPARSARRAAALPGRALAALRRPALRRPVGPAAEPRTAATAVGRLGLRQRIHGPPELRRRRPPRGRWATPRLVALTDRGRAPADPRRDRRREPDGGGPAASWTSASRDAARIRAYGAGLRRDRRARSTFRKASTSAAATRGSS